MAISNYNIHNVEALKRKKPKIRIYFLFIFLLFLECFFFSFLTFPTIKKFYGIYHCSEVCTIESLIPIDSAIYFKENNRMEINGKSFKMPKISFLEINTTQNKEVFQTIIITISKQDYYNYQMISYSIKSDDEIMWKLLWKAMKGGES